MDAAVPTGKREMLTGFISSCWELLEQNSGSSFTLNFLKSSGCAFPAAGVPSEDTTHGERGEFLKSPIKNQWDLADKTPQETPSSLRHQLDLS